jgi:magnesium-transporting ATPase (P-type)
LLETGCRIPADSILIEGVDIKIDESYYYPNNRSAITKTVASDANVYSSPDPFLLSNTLVASGSGKAVVCAVGGRSRRGLTADKLDTSSSTPL